ncbi:hypothetical protein FALBO_11371 [Fusarium albosuccineum]|uniref:Uncharacterized protein n=1 Tax=Fusarium albosuccineum TaxID=1237068 RepID=A0A8H4L2N6_9HYPO|nr:hypothetical protein FALBO_11371 [Fusarium albosuccineum]
MGSSQHLIKAANRAFARTLIDGPFTSMGMLRFLITKKASMTIFDFIKNPAAIKKIDRAKFANDSIDGNLRPLWARSLGRCTSFTMNVTAQLQQGFPGVFSFFLYNQGKHRLARCQSTGICIDSSSINGAFKLPEGVRKRFGNTECEWQWQDGACWTKTGNGLEYTSNVPISGHEALGMCLAEVAKGLVGVTLFRSVKVDGTTTYHRMIKWSFQKSKCRLDLVPSLVSEARKVAICWGLDSANNTNKDDKECIQMLHSFCVQHGGPHWQAQWTADGLDEITQSFWTAANAAFGFPKYVV